MRPTIARFNAVAPLLTNQAPPGPSPSGLYATMRRAARQIKTGAIAFDGNGWA